MRGFATIDRMPGARHCAVWITSAFDRAAEHVNAVVLDLEEDAAAPQKLRALTRRNVVLLTEGSTTEDLPIDHAPLKASDIEVFLDETALRQEQILDAVAEYRRQKRFTTSRPEFTARPTSDQFLPDEDTPSGRALATADYLRNAWTLWLRTESERLARTVQPRTGTTPWIMSPELNGPMEMLPPGFAAGVRIEALV